MISVLDIDDEKYDKLLFATHIIRLSSGIDIPWVQNADEVLKPLETEEFDCIVSDYQMFEANC